MLNQQDIIKVSFILLTSICLALWPLKSDACTLWAVAGDSVQGGGTILSKNRDWIPNHQQQLRLVKPIHGYRYISLYAEGSGTKAGINEKGLSVVSASPPSYLEAPTNWQGKQGNTFLLANYATVDQAVKALHKGDWAAGPENILLADGHEIVDIEFGLNGSFNINTRTSSGQAFQTNHYLSEKLKYLNPEKLGSSKSRYDRIRELLESKMAASVEDTKTFSNDPTLWRQGNGKADSVRTMSSWIVSRVPDGTTRLYVKMANPNKPVKEYEFNTQEIFDGKIDLSEVH